MNFNLQRNSLEEDVFLKKKEGKKIYENFVGTLETVRNREVSVRRGSTNQHAELHFECPFNLIGKLIMPFLTGYSWYLFKSMHTGGGPEQRFWHCFLQTNFNYNQKFSFIWHRQKRIEHVGKLDSKVTRDYQMTFLYMHSVSFRNLEYLKYFRNVNL